MSGAAVLTEAVRGIAQALRRRPRQVTSSAYGAPPMWEIYLPQAKAAGTAFAGRLRTMAEEARAAAMTATEQLEAERLRARADALHEAAGMLDERLIAAENVVEFRRK